MAKGLAGPHAVSSYELFYDASGNMLTKEHLGGRKTFKYDVENRLVEATSEGIVEDISSYTINLNAGWNFISLPIMPSQDIASILQAPGISKAQVSRYNAQTQKWESFVYEEGQDLTRFCDFTTFEYGRGYLVYVDTSSTMAVSGAVPQTQNTLQLYPGWNLIAAPTTTTISAGEALQGVSYSSLRGAEGNEAISYVEASSLQAGKGYFLHVAAQQTWNIPQEQTKTTFVYDGDGGRVKVTSNGGRGTTEAISTTYIGSLYETSLRSAAGGEAISIKKHIFLGSTRICTVESSLRGGSEATDEAIYYFHQDHIGSSNVITDGNGTQVQLLEYSPYGLTSREEGSYNTDYRFTGKLFDNSTELYYYGARYYDPELGRFTQPDTIVPYPDDPQSFNRYAYARNNPIRYIDPSGHSFLAALVAILSFIAAVAGTVATVAGVGAMVAGALGYGDLANTLGKVALVASVVAIAASAGAQICNILATPSPPGIYSDLTKLDSKVLSEVTGYDELPLALQDEPLLEAGGSSVYESKAVAKNAQALSETLGLSEGPAKVIGAEITTVNIGHQELLGYSEHGIFSMQTIGKYGTYTGENAPKIEIFNFVTGEEARLGKATEIFGLDLFVGSSTKGAIKINFGHTTYSFGGGQIFSLSKTVKEAGFYKSIETSISLNLNPLCDFVRSLNSHKISPVSTNNPKFVPFIPRHTPVY